MAVPILMLAAGLVLGPARPVQSQEPARIPVGERGEIEKIDFEGVESFTREAIGRGLLMNGKFMSASHPRADFEDFKAVFLDALMRGYRDGGFPDVAVRLKEDGESGRLTAVVEEGPRFRKGGIVIRGVDDKLAAAIAGHLTEVDEMQRDPRRAYLHRIRNYFGAATASLAPEPTEEEKVEELLNEDKGIEFKVIPADEQILNYFGYPVEMPAARGRAGREENDGMDFVPSYREKSQLWIEGEVFSFSDHTRIRWMSALREALSEFGYRSARIAMQFDRDLEKGTVSLVADIEKLGQPAVIGLVRVEGREINSARQILDFIGLKSGAPLTKAILEEAELRLIESGRFLAHRIVLQPQSAIDTDRPVDILLQLTECPDAPALDEALNPRQKALLGLMNWFSHLPEGGEDLVLSWSSTELDLEKAGLEGKKVQLPAGRFILSPLNGLLLMIGDIEDEDAVPEEEVLPSVLALEFSNRANAVYSISGPDVRRWEGPPYTGSIIFALSTIPNGDPWDEGPMSVNFGGSFSGERKGGEEVPVMLNLFAAPVGALYADVHRDGMLSQPKPGILMMGEPGEQYMKVDELTGRLLEAFVGAEGLEARIVPEHGAYERYRQKLGEITGDAVNEYEGEDAGRSIFTLLADHVLESELLMSQLNEGEQELFASLAKLLMEEDGIFEAVEDVLSGWLGSGDGGESFVVPYENADILNPNQLLSGMAALTLGPAGAVFPEDSWMRKLAREVVFVAAGNRDHVEALVEELAVDPAPMGPLAYRVTTALLDRVRSPFANRMAIKGYGLLNEEAFRRDWQPLLASDRPISAGLLRLMEVVVELESARESTAVSPAELQEVVEAHRAGDHEDALVLLEPLVAMYWNSGFSARLKKSFEERLGIAGIDRKEVAAVVNRDRVTRFDVARAVGLDAVKIDEAADRAGRERQAVDQLIDRKLLFREFLRLGGNFPVDRIEAGVKNFLTKVGEGDPRVGMDRLGEFGISRNDIFSAIREMMAHAFMVNKARVPPDAVLREYHAGHPDEFVEPPAVRLHMISLEKSEENHELLKEIREKIVGGADFAKLAIRHSVDSKAAEGGDWGWVSRATLKEEITDRAFALESGEVGEVFEFLDHYRLIRAGKKREASQKPFDRVREELASRLAKANGDQYTTAYLERLRRNAAIIHFENEDGWSAWETEEKAASMGRLRVHAFEEMPVAIEGKLIDGVPRYRMRMEPKPDPDPDRIWILGLDEDHYLRSQRDAEKRGLKEIYHQEFANEEGEARHQVIWRK